MSFDIFVDCFSKQQPKCFPRQIIETAFAPYVKRREKDILVLAFHDAQSTVFYDDAFDSSGFCVNRPSWSHEFWEAVISILTETNGVLHWPGTGCVITNAAVRDDLPQDMLDALGEPTVTDNIDEVLACIEKTA